MKVYYYLILCHLVLASACGGDDIIIDPLACSVEVNIDETSYNETKSAQYQIVSATIDSDCLHIVISSSGCDGARWNASLIDRNAIAESSPEQRYIRLVLENDEECDAVFEREFSFLISDLQIQNNGVLILNLLDFQDPLRYEY